MNDLLRRTISTKENIFQGLVINQAFKKKKDRKKKETKKTFISSLSALQKVDGCGWMGGWMESTMSRGLNLFLQSHVVFPNRLILFFLHSHSAPHLLFGLILNILSHLHHPLYPLNRLRLGVST